MLQRYQQALKRDRLRIAISAYPICILRLRAVWGGSRGNIATLFSMKKLECVATQW